MLKPDDYAMKISKLFSIIEGQGGWAILNITIHTSNIRGTRMEKYGYNSHPDIS